MPVKVRIPTPLRRLTDNRAEVYLEGHTVSDVMKALESTYPAFRNRLFDDNGRLRRFISVFVNDTDIRKTANEETPVTDGDEVTIVPAVAGG